MNLIPCDYTFNGLACAAFLYKELHLRSRVATHTFAALVNGQLAAIGTVYLHYDITGFYVVAYSRRAFIGLHYHNTQRVLADSCPDSSVRRGRHHLYGLGIFLRNIFCVRVYGLQHGVYAVVYQLGKIHGVHIFCCQGAQDVILDFKALRKLEVAALGIASQ